MPALPPRLSLEQVRRLAKDLLRDLKDGDRASQRDPQARAVALEPARVRRAVGSGRGRPSFKDPRRRDEEP